jgi:glycosyltransferase involved in cell wall biosynthesis
VIVHNPAAAALVQQHAPQTPVVEIPHLFQTPALPAPAATQLFRQRLGIGEQTLLIGTFGHQRETKRLTVLLRAFHQAVQTGADLSLLVSGDFVSSTFENAVAPLLNHPRILRTAYLPETDLWRYAAAVDVCVNLRYPSAAETSGIAIRMMGIGKAVIFTAGAALDRIPEHACLRVAAGPEEEPMLAGYLAWLAGNRDAAAAIGQRAAAHIAQHHDPKTVARAYWDALTKYKAAQ